MLVGNFVWTWRLIFQLVSVQWPRRNQRKILLKTKLKK